MSKSLTVHKLEKVCKALTDKESFSLNNQTSVYEWGVGIEDGFIPQTKILYKYTDENHIHYAVSADSALIKEPIIVYWNEIEQFKEYTKGYSSISKFKFIIDHDYENIYIFSPKKISDRFIKQMAKERKMTCSNISFNFSLISELKNLISAWGIWEDSRGAITKTARFGPDITTEIFPEDYASITTMYIDYSFDQNTIQLILNAEGRISTQNKIDNGDMLDIYEDIKNTLVSVENPVSKKNRRKKGKKQAELNFY